MVIFPSNNIITFKFYAPLTFESFSHLMKMLSATNDLVVSIFIVAHLCIHNKVIAHVQCHGQFSSINTILLVLIPLFVHCFSDKLNVNRLQVFRDPKSCPWQIQALVSKTIHIVYTKTSKRFHQQCG